MTPEEFAQLAPGFYRVHWTPWHGGGFSDVAIGRAPNGNIWFAPTNWTSPIQVTQEAFDTARRFPERTDYLWDAIEHIHKVYSYH